MRTATLTNTAVRVETNYIAVTNTYRVDAHTELSVIMEGRSSAMAEYHVTMTKESRTVRAHARLLGTGRYTVGLYEGGKQLDAAEAYWVGDAVAAMIEGVKLALGHYDAIAIDGDVVDHLQQARRAATRAHRAALAA
jgi:hypothetical protein